MSELTTGWSLRAVERRGQIRLANDGKTPLPFKLTMSVLPATCPFEVDQMLDLDWWPVPRGED